MINSELPGFYRLDRGLRRERLRELFALSPRELSALSAGTGLSDDGADRMVENAIGVFGLPLGVCANLRIDGHDRIVPMAVEEPSVIAGASHAAKLLRRGGGVTTEVRRPLMIGQVQLLDVPDGDRLASGLRTERDRLLSLCNDSHPGLVTAGGGAIDLGVRALRATDPKDPLGTMWIVELVVDARDAMGANAINSMCERIAPELEAISGGRANLRILSNLCDQRTVVATGRVPVEALSKRGPDDGARVARCIEAASVFAERDPFRATTHNKGVMNGVDAVLIALGQDFRAVEAGAHAFAARSGRYTALSTWRVDGAALVGRLELPLAVGTVGGIVDSHPTVRVLRRIARIDGAADLAAVAAAVGLAENLGSLRALADEGIQQGHMRLHARKRPARSTPPPAVPSLSAIAREHLESIEAAMAREAETALPDGSPLHEPLAHHLATGGKRLRALLPLAVAEALGHDPADLVPFGAACEMLHNATLVHDDLQDGDTTRRGAATVWAKYGEARAIDLGDAMFYLAVLLTHRLDGTPARREALSRRLLRSTLRVIDGQEREMLLHDDPAPTVDTYLRMVEGKTSGLFALPIAGAAEACGADPVLVASLEEAARHLGVVFQIQDDVLDLFGDKGRQRRGSDIAEGKRSILAVHALGNAPAAERAELRSILDAARDETTDDAIARAIAILDRSGAVDFALDTIEERRRLAIGSHSIRARPELHELLTKTADRFLEPIHSVFAARRRAS